jgi:hypothetical protein
MYWAFRRSYSFTQYQNEKGALRLLESFTYIPERKTRYFDTAPKR